MELKEFQQHYHPLLHLEEEVRQLLELQNLLQFTLTVPVALWSQTWELNYLLHYRFRLCHPFIEQSFLQVSSWRGHQEAYSSTHHLLLLLLLQLTFQLLISSTAQCLLFFFESILLTFELPMLEQLYQTLLIPYSCQHHLLPFRDLSLVQTSLFITESIFAY